MKKAKIVMILLVSITIFMNGNFSQATFQVSEQEYVSFYANKVYKEIYYDGVLVPVSIAICSSINDMTSAYSLKYERKCVDEITAYSAQLNGILHDNEVKKILINGYPNQSYQKLNAVNEEEAYIITQMAIFNTYYQYDFQKMTVKEDSQYPNIISKIQEFIHKVSTLNQEDTIDFIIDENTLEWQVESEEWISKEYKMISNMPFENYSVSVQSLSDVKVVNQENQLQEQFTANETFKVLIPKNQSLDFTISVKADFLTCPVRFAKGPGDFWEDYFLLGISETVETNLIQSYQYYENQEEKPDEAVEPEEIEVNKMNISPEKKLPQTGM